MKNQLFLILAATAAILSCSCASLEFNNPEAVRPLATVATAAYVAEGDYLERVSRETNMRVAATQLRTIALSENPTAEAAALALEQVSLDPAYRAAAQSLIRLYAPRTVGESDGSVRATLLLVADGIEDALPRLPSK
jgi:hypothetical protein